ncbi:MAG: hypothetical protein GIW99_09035 [Candidatus Eremiobacteraeota bacterium]|nr:hypothetical protein [Candidatus Eremiobacteraeota bacterium]MBC5827807.1 hypothetical protein [Candidatus Eremiobacteraeota bacterium]
MKLFTTVDRPSLEKSVCLAESSDFAIYDLGSDTYALVQRHQGVEWQGVTFSGDALFRVSELINAATRTLYRDLASQLSPKRRIAKEEHA